MIIIAVIDGYKSTIHIQKYGAIVIVRHVSESHDSLSVNDSVSGPNVGVSKSVIVRNVGVGVVWVWVSVSVSVSNADVGVSESVIVRNVDEGCGSVSLCQCQCQMSGWCQ